jgi:hypothetical protein
LQVEDMEFKVQMGNVCIVGGGPLNIDYTKGTVGVGDKVLKDGDWISIDGFTGEVIAGQLATKPSEVVQVLIDRTLKREQSKVYPQFADLMQWADEHRKLGIRTNADLPGQAQQAVAFGAEGIGQGRQQGGCATGRTPVGKILRPLQRAGRKTLAPRRGGYFARLRRCRRRRQCAPAEKTQGRVGRRGLTCAPLAPPTRQLPRPQSVRIPPALR